MRNTREARLSSQILRKGDIGEDEIESIERAKNRPHEWRITPTLRRSTEGAEAVLELTVRCFYWGIRQTIEKALRATQISAAPLRKLPNVARTST